MNKQQYPDEIINLAKELLSKNGNIPALHKFIQMTHIGHKEAERIFYYIQEGLSENDNIKV